MFIPKSLELFEVEFWKMEIGQFIWGSQTVLLPERDE